MRRVVVVAAVAIALTSSGSAQGSQDNTQLFPVGEGDKAGYMDKAGTLVIKLQFDDAQQFSEGLAAVSAGGKWGYIDTVGTFVISPQFDGAGPFSEGLAPVMVDDRWGYIDRTGRMRISPQFHHAEQFRNGVAAVTVDGGWGWDWRGWIDRTAKYVWAPQILQTPDEPPDDEYSRAMKSDLRDLVTAEERYFAYSVKYIAPATMPNYSFTTGVSFVSGSTTRDGWWAVVQHRGATTRCGIFIGQSRGASGAVAEGKPRCRHD